MTESTTFLNGFIGEAGMPHTYAVAKRIAADNNALKAKGQAELGEVVQMQNDHIVALVELCARLETEIGLATGRVVDMTK